MKAHGIRCWLDDHQIYPGDDLRDQVDKGINLWDKILLCCSRAALSSPWVNTEIDKALKKEERLWRERGQKTLACQCGHGGRPEDFNFGTIQAKDLPWGGDVLKIEYKERGEDLNHWLIYNRQDLDTGGFLSWS